MINMKWYKIATHEYMDEYPDVFYKLATAQEVLEYADHMNKNYSGGTTHVLGFATKAEVLEYIIKNEIDLTDEVKANTLNDEYYA